MADTAKLKKDNQAHNKLNKLKPVVEKSQTRGRIDQRDILSAIPDKPETSNYLIAYIPNWPI